jgi:arginase family enzyme
VQVATDGERTPVISLLSAPTNLGLRPPAPGSVPGCSKAPEALREAGLFRRFLELGAQDAGVVLPGRYVDDAAPDASRLRNQDQMVTFSRRLSDRISSLLDARHPLVVGGDCSLLIGVGHALRRRGGKVGLVHIDGHTDFRHPGNSPVCLSAAGEDLAILVGQHWDTIADIDGYRPYVPADQAIHVGCREDDEHLDEARQRVGLVVTASDLIADPSELSIVSVARWSPPSVIRTGSTSTSMSSIPSSCRRSTPPTRAGSTPTCLSTCSGRSPLMRWAPMSRSMTRIWTLPVVMRLR